MATMVQRIFGKGFALGDATGFTRGRQSMLDEILAAQAAAVARHKLAVRDARLDMAAQLTANVIVTLAPPVYRAARDGITARLAEKRAA